MADIIIRGMEMPKYGCDNCFLRTGKYCGRIDKDEIVVDYARKSERHPDCPLGEVPPHGKLIDADEFLDRAIGTRCFRGDYALMLEELVGESTTIIPASEVYE